MSRLLFLSYTYAYTDAIYLLGDKDSSIFELLMQYNMHL